MRLLFRNTSLVCGVVAVVGLSGCARVPSEGPDSAQLSVLYEYSSDSHKTATEAALQDCGKEKGVSLELQPVAQEQLPDVLQTRLAGGDPPDVLLTVPTRMQDLMVNGQLLNLSEHMPEKYAEPFGANGLLAETYEGEVYGFPLSRGIRAVAYNADLFQKAGVDVPQKIDDAWTWEEMVDAAKEVKEKTGIPYGLQFEKPSFDGWIPFLYQAGGALFTADMSRPAINEPAGVEALQWTADLHSSGLAAPGIIEGVENPLQIFASGQSALWLGTGSYSVPGLEAQVTTFRYGFTYMPKNEKAATSTFGNDIVALRSTQHPEQAWGLIECITSAADIAGISNGMGNLPARADAEGVDLARDDLVPFFLDQATQVDPTMVKHILTPVYAATRDALLRELQAMLGGGQDPQTTADKMAAILQEEIERTK